MKSKSGTPGTEVGKDKGDDFVYRRGGKRMFLDRRLSKDCFSYLWRLLMDIGVTVAGDRGRIDRFPCTSGNDDDDEGKHSIADAALASTGRPLAMTGWHEADFSLAIALHLHFHRFLQLQGFSKESTIELVNE